MWIKDLFKIPTLYVNENERYFGHFFSNILNILDCKFKTPREIHWKGHPFYFNLLKTLKFISQIYPKNVEHLLSMPLWFNSCLNTKYDVELSRAGFNFLKDLFPSNQLLEMNEQNVLRLSPPKRRFLIQIIQKIPAEWGDRILEEAVTNVTVLPINTIHINSSDTRVNLLSSKSTSRVGGSDFRRSHHKCNCTSNQYYPIQQLRHKGRSSEFKKYLFNIN